MTRTPLERAQAGTQPTMAANPGVGPWAPSPAPNRIPRSSSPFGSGKPTASTYGERSLRGPAPGTSGSIFAPKIGTSREALRTAPADLGYSREPLRRLSDAAGVPRTKAPLDRSAYAPDGGAGWGDRRGMWGDGRGGNGHWGGDHDGGHYPNHLHGYPDCYYDYHVGHHGYSHDDYYHGYRPICYPHYPYHSYYPWFGFSYISAYQYEPVYPYYYDDGYYGAYVEPPPYYAEPPPGYPDGYYVPEGGADVYDAPPTGYKSVPAPVPPVGIDGGLAGPPGPYGDGSPTAVVPTDSTLVDEGTKAFRAGQYEESRSLFIRAILADERDGFAKLMYGLSSFALGDYAVAAVSMRRALLTSDLLVEKPIDVRMLYDDTTVFDAQLNRLTTAVFDKPDDRDAKFVKAYVMFSIGLPGVATELFQELAESDKADALSARLAKVAHDLKPVESAGKEADNRD